MLSGAAPVSADPVVTDFGSFELVSSTRVGRATFEYEFRPAVIGDQLDRSNVELEVTSTSGATQIIDGSASFGSVAAGETVFASDTIVFRHDRRVAFDPGVFDYAVTFDLPPIQLDYEIDAANAVRETLDIDGGEISLQTGSGVGVTLSIPSNATDETVEFSVTPVTSIAGAPIGFEPVVAVALGPADTSLAAPATLTFDLPPGVRQGRVALGFFTNDDGSEFYLTPLIGPDGLVAGNDVDRVSLVKQSFSVGGVAFMDSIFFGPQRPPISDVGRAAQALIANIAARVAFRQMLGDLGSYLPSELAEIAEILLDWNRSLTPRFGTVLADFRAGDVSDANVSELFAIIAENLTIEAIGQAFDIATTASNGFLTSESMVTQARTAFDQILAVSFEDCTDPLKARQSEQVRLQLFVQLQLLGVNEGVTEEDWACRYDVTLTPTFTQLFSELQEAEIDATFDSFNPQTMELVPVPTATFALLDNFALIPSSNVEITEIGFTQFRFRVSGTEVGTVTLQGNRVLSPVTVSAQVEEQDGYSGLYRVDFDGNASGCTDPEDNGPASGSFLMPLAATLLAEVNGVRTYALSGGASGATLDLTLVETPSSVSGEATIEVPSAFGTYTETERELIFVDGEPLLCTYTSSGSADFAGLGLRSGEAVEMGLAGSNFTYGFTGEPAVCGSGTCAAISGGLTLTRQ